MNTKSVYELERRLSGTPTSCGTIAVPAGPHGYSHEAAYIDAFLSARGILHRTVPRNRFLGYILSVPSNSPGTQILGRAYWDHQDACDNEDLFEIRDGQIRRLRPREAKATYPEYAGTHRGDKSYLIGFADQGSAKLG